jgi:hypothetical protein
MGQSHVGCAADELRMPMSLNLAALVSQPPADYNPDGLDWESSGLFLSGDESHSDCEMDPSRGHTGRFGFIFQNSSNSHEDVCPPSKVRRQGQEGSALESWASLQRLLDVDSLSHSFNSTTNNHSNGNQPARLLSLALPMQASSSAIISGGDFSSRLTQLSHSGKQSSGRNHSRNNSSSGSGGGSAVNGGSCGYKQPRKFASSLASSIAKKTPGPRNILSSAATATAACAAAASSSSTFAYNGAYLAAHSNSFNSTTNGTSNVIIISPSVINNSSHNAPKPVGAGDVATSVVTDLAGQVAMDAILDKAADAFFH